MNLKQGPRAGIDSGETPMTEQSCKHSVTIVICAFNEERTIGTVIGKVRTLDYVSEILILNNGSVDGTQQKIDEAVEGDARCRVLRVEKNLGLGGGIRMLFTESSGDIVARQDADLEYDPDELFSLVEQIDNGTADVVYGSRFLVRRAHRVHYFYNYIANKLLSFISNVLTNKFISDVETAVKAFNGPILRSLTLHSTGFEIENELTMKLSAAGCEFYEVPISYYGRNYAEGKKIRWHDGIRALWYIFFYWIVAYGGKSKLPKVAGMRIGKRSDSF